ncbi:MAG: hypothetical protein D6735_06690 [Acidobacteria bacterium]|nr:MAG: hypothetical protein D6735_06690 [Acidobacteriota bacterium]
MISFLYLPPYSMAATKAVRHIADATLSNSARRINRWLAGTQQWRGQHVTSMQYLMRFMVFCLPLAFQTGIQQGQFMDAQA